MTDLGLKNRANIKVVYLGNYCYNRESQSQMGVTEIWIGDDIGNLSLAYDGIRSSGFFELDPAINRGNVRYLVIRK